MDNGVIEQLDTWIKNNPDKLCEPEREFKIYPVGLINDIVAFQIKECDEIDNELTNLKKKYQKKESQNKVDSQIASPKTTDSKITEDEEWEY